MGASRPRAWLSADSRVWLAKIWSGVSLGALAAAPLESPLLVDLTAVTTGAFAFSLVSADCCCANMLCDTITTKPANTIFRLPCIAFAPPLERETILIGPKALGFCGRDRKNCKSRVE